MRNPDSKPGGNSRLDLATAAGLVLAVGAIGGGMMLEGGNIRDIAQVTSALIVLGGTAGAVMITTPMNILIRAAGRIGTLFARREASTEEAIDEIIGYAILARRGGIVSLESQAEQIVDPFLRKALRLAVDGIEPAQIRDIMELEIQLLEESLENEANVFDAAGGYAPTIGIIGAVLGLIQVMKNLASIDDVGRGIAVAFVATIYGVASANILFLPAARKLRARARDIVRVRELTLEGVVSIAGGVNQRLIRTKLEAYAGGEQEVHTARGRTDREPVSAGG